MREAAFFACSHELLHCISERNVTSIPSSAAWSLVSKIFQRARNPAIEDGPL
jgi:hypothetical protein